LTLRGPFLASGHAGFADGNNQESSSEAINAWQAIILWGEATGNKTIRDLGIYLYTTEVEAVCNYWFDLYKDIFSPSYGHNYASMVWGGKYCHEIWWTVQIPKAWHKLFANHSRFIVSWKRPELYKAKL